MSRSGCSLVVLVASLAIAPTAYAQQSDLSAASVSSEAAPAVAAGATAVQPAPLLTHAPQQKRPAAMVPLYTGFAAVQILDYTSTMQALSSGAGREGNPVMAPLAGSPAAMFAVKAASVAGVVWAGEKLWKKNRVGAIVFMVAMDSAMATVVAHNYSVAHR